MSDLYHVVYAGTRSVGWQRAEEGVEGLKNIYGSRFNRMVIQKTESILVDHPNDMEEVINTLDDLQIPAFSIYNDYACLFTSISFIVSGDMTTNETLLSVLSKINSKK